MSARARFKPYPAYKDSGVEGLGEIPAHWDLKRLKEVADIRVSNVDKKSVDGEQPVRLCNYTDVYYNDRITAALEFMSASATAAQVQQFKLRKYDVLITKDSETPTDIAVPAVVVMDLPGVICGYHLALIRPRDALWGPYLARAFASVGVRDQFHLLANGITRFGLTHEAIRDSLFPIPSTSEQRAIAAFLDRETARIDALVAKNERLIELLQEKRTALITRAVTKGLDPSVPMKDSGVEWLGEIPKHWEVRRLKSVCEFQRGHDLPEEKREEGKVPVVSSSGRTATHSRAIANGPGIVTGRYGTIGDFYLVEEDYWPLNTTLYSVDLHENDPRFLWYMLTNLSSQFELNSLKSAVPGVDRNDIHPTPTAIPPIREQQLIAELLNERTRRVDHLAAKVRDAIARLNELRTALISAAVTGKIDVREEAA